MLYGQVSHGAEKSNIDFYVDEGLYISATELARRAFKNEKKVFESQLYEIAKHQNISSLLSNVAQTDELSLFGNDRHYYRGLGLVGKSPNAALAAWALLGPKDKHYAQGKFLTAHTVYRAGYVSKAYELWRQLDVEIESRNLTVSSGVKDQLILARARLEYELGKYKLSSKTYSRISKNSRFFSSTLLEKGWAFLMAGYPESALGSIYDLNSPFFERQFLPEAVILEASILFSLCRYDESRQALAKFQTYKATLAKVSGFTGQRYAAYRLFEHRLAGVSEKFLQVPADITSLVSESEKMISYRGILADLLEEREKIRSLSSSPKKDWAASFINQKIEQQKKTINDYMTSQILGLQKSFEKQSQDVELMRVEFLMNEAGAASGKKFSYDSAYVGSVAGKSWSEGAQVWSRDNKREFWWDEIGHHVAHKPSLCKQSESQK